MKGLGDIMKQAQAMQEHMKQMQEDLANMEVQGEAGAGLVKVTMTGRHDVKKVEIDDSLLSDDKEVLEDLIAAAVNNAVRKVEEEGKNKIGGMTEGMNIPGFKWPL
ncbi:YbaB/EbfC family nucleoid-associated protein [Gilvimarinus sp. F26214L]|uniref:YbaB/EbfC family nucleoid-associated protein n=1 Tax=Gilvimarinus sp. DZF01 TaxID=3461371 RepID=UPI004045913F